MSILITFLKYLAPVSVFSTKLINSWEKIVILDSNLLASLVVNIHPQHSILLFHENPGALIKCPQGSATLMVTSLSLWAFMARVGPGLPTNPTWVIPHGSSQLSSTLSLKFHQGTLELHSS